MSSNWSEQQQTRSECKEKNRTRREKLAGFFFDLAKLVFAGLVLGGISPLLSDNTDNIKVFPVILGIITTYFFAFFANRILKQ